LSLDIERIEINQNLDDTGKDCEQCMDMITSVEGLKTIGLPKDCIVSFIKMTCSEDDYPENCKRAVDENIDEVLKQIDESKTPKEICENIKYCSSDSNFNFHRLNSLKQMQFKANIRECQLCEDTVGQLATMKIGNVSNECIGFYVDYACKTSNSPLGCQALAEKYLDQVLKDIANNEEVNEICEELQACEKKPEKKAFSESSFCTVCEFLVSNLETQAKKQDSMESIKNIFDIFCDYVFDLFGYEQECQEFVDDNLEFVVQILTEVSPKELCESIGFCESNLGAFNKDIRCVFDDQYACANFEQAKKCNVSKFLKSK
jgi:hypothetical protein